MNRELDPVYFSRFKPVWPPKAWPMLWWQVKCVGEAPYVSAQAELGQGRITGRRSKSFMEVAAKEALRPYVGSLPRYAAIAWNADMLQKLKNAEFIIKICEMRTCINTMNSKVLNLVSNTNDGFKSFILHLIIPKRFQKVIRRNGRFACRKQNLHCRELSANKCPL